MNLFFKFLSFLVLLIALESCSIPEVQPSSKSVIVLASDFLYPRDSALFLNFEKQQNIKVKIKHLSTDSIISHFAHYRYNSQFDGVLMHSTYSLYKLSKEKVLHPLSSQLEQAPKGAKSPKNDWLVFGLDPYVIDFGRGETKNIAYNEFTHDVSWEPVLTKDESAAFFASVLHQFGRNNIHKSVKWLQEMKDHMRLSESTDTLPKASFTLTRFSHAQRVYNHFVLPTQGRIGVFYDGIGVASIQHSKKYAEITALQLYLMKGFNNQAITGKLFLFPIDNPNGHSDFKFQNNYPSFFRCTPFEAAKEYRDVQRVLRKLDITFPKEIKQFDIKKITELADSVGN